MFDFRLQVFQEVATRLSFTRAAESLYISQPAVTRHIHELEEHFKLKLFDRTGNKVFLTPAGKTLLEQANKIFMGYRELEFEMSQLSKTQSGKLRIGASTTVAQYVLSPILASFRQKYPAVKISLSTGNTEEIEQALISGSIDFGLIEGFSKNKAIRYESFSRDEIVLVAGPTAKKASIKLDDLKKIPLLLREPGSGTREVILHALKGAGLKAGELQIEMQLDSTEAIKSYLMHSNCMAFLSIHSILRELKDKECQVIEIKGFRIERPFYFILGQGDRSGLSTVFIRFSKNFPLK